jgi:hypothetical protein
MAKVCYRGAQSDDYAEKSRHIFRVDRSGAAHVRITKIGIVPMTRRSDIIKIFAIAALLGIAFYYLAHYGLSWPQRP